MTSSRLARKALSRRSARCVGRRRTASRCARVAAASIRTTSRPAASSSAGKGCYHQFSPDLGHDLRRRKMAYVDLLAAILIVMDAAKGMSALQLAREIDCQHKTAFVLCHKLREAMAV